MIRILISLECNLHFCKTRLRKANNLKLNLYKNVEAILIFMRHFSNLLREFVQKSDKI